MENTCPHCGKPFVPGKANQRYCSRQCRIREQSRAARERKRTGTRQQAERVCPVCGKTFALRSPSQLYCSHACRLKQMGIRRREKNQENAPKERACLVCGRTYRPRMRTQKTCGREGCQRKWANMTSQLRGKRPRLPRTKPQVGKLCGEIISPWGCGEYCCQSCKTADGDGSARRELYPDTAGLIRKWHGEGMAPEAIANLLERDLRQVKEVLDDA